MTDPLIEVHKLCVAYDSFQVLRDINISIQRGEFVSIVGKSGCGKSTFLLALAGFIASSGMIRMPKQIGMVFQNYAVFPWLTVRNNIGFGLRHLSEVSRRPIVDSYLQMVDLVQHADKYPAQLSGGQTQRVALARAFAPDPPVIFMDEPFGALDSYTRNNMQEFLQQTWQRDSKTVLFVTHSIEEAMFLSDRVLLFSDGRLHAELHMPFKRPRAAEIKFSPEFVELRKEILTLLESEATRHATA